MSLLLWEEVGIAKFSRLNFALFVLDLEMLNIFQKFLCAFFIIIGKFSGIKLLMINFDFNLFLPPFACFWDDVILKIDILL